MVPWAVQISMVWPGDAWAMPMPPAACNNRAKAAMIAAQIPCLEAAARVISGHYKCERARATIFATPAAAPIVR